MSGDLPLLSLSLSDLRLQEILQLAQSIPLPEVGDEDQEIEDMDVFSVSLIVLVLALYHRPLGHLLQPYIIDS